MRLRRTLVIAVSMWAAVVLARVALYRAQGLRGQYFSELAFAGPASSAQDPEISTAQVYRRFRETPPETFAVQWSGYLHVHRRGHYTFSTITDGESRLYVDRRLVLVNAGSSPPVARLGDVQLDSGPHAVVVQYAHKGSRCVIEWSWARDGSALEPVPDWALSPTPQYGTTLVARGLDWLCWVLGGAAVVLAVILALGHVVRATRGDRAWLGARVALFLLLGWLFVAAATEHAAVVNTFKARGDQNDYLWDAEQVYANLNGRTPSVLIGGRARMPIYAGYLSLFYTPRLTDPEFFVVAKTWNVRLAVVLIGALAIIFAWHLPPLISTNLSLIVAFGYFVFKAGYAQPELLFYFLFFVAFLACWHLFRRPARASSLAWGCLAGTMAGLAYLTKALVPPFVAVFLVVYTIQALVVLIRRSRLRDGVLEDFGWRMAAATAVAISFFVTVYPYVANSKRISGAYFYNLNTTHYIWYDTGSQARIATLPNTDANGRIRMPAEQLPSVRTYLATHSVAQILGRLADGLGDMAIRSYSAYAFWKYLVIYATLTLALIGANRRAALTLMRERAALVLFLASYAAIYLVGTAFFTPISGTGSMRFLLTHATPLFFVVSCFFARAPFDQSEWAIWRLRVTPTHFHVLVLVLMAFDLTFTLRPRLMSMYGGF